MSRIDRIRRTIVTRAVATDGWWDEEPLKNVSVSGMLQKGQLGRHLWRQTEGRRRQIVERLLALSAEEFTA